MKVPTIGLGNVQTEVVSQPVVTPDQMGAAAWRQIGDAANAGLKVADVLAREQAKQDAASADAAIANAQIRLNNLSNDVQKNYQGELLSKRGSEFDKGAEGVRAEVSKNLPAGAARHFNQAWSSAIAQQKISLDDKTAKDSEAFQIGAFQSRIDAGVQFISGETDEKLAATRLADMENELVRFNESRGMTGIYSPEATKASIMALRAKAYVGRANTIALKQDGGAILAQNYIDSKKAFITPEVYQEFTKANAVAYKKESEAAFAHQWLVDNPGTVSEQFAKATQLPDGVREATWNMIAKNKEDRDKINSADYMRMLDQAVNGETVIAKNSAVAGTPEYAAAMVILGKKGDTRPVDYGVYDKLLAQMKTGQWENIPQAITQASDRLSRDGAARLFQLYSQKRGGADVTNDVALDDEKSTIKAMYQTANGNAGKTLNPANPDYLVFKKSYEDAVASKEAASKSPLSSNDRIDIARLLLLKQDMGWGRKQPVYRGVVYSVTDGSIVKEDIVNYAKAVGIIKSNDNSISTQQLVALYRTFDQKGDIKTDVLMKIGDKNLIDMISDQLKDASTQFK